jgi:hypothetical protein
MILDREDQKAAICGCTLGISAIVLDREDQKAAILGCTFQ